MLQQADRRSQLDPKRLREFVGLTGKICVELNTPSHGIPVAIDTHYVNSIFNGITSRSGESHGPVQKKAGWRRRARQSSVRRRFNGMSGGWVAVGVVGGELISCVTRAAIGVSET
jgi:hypothetical protein